MATREKFRRKKRSERLSKPEYMANRINDLNAQLLTEDRDYIVDKIKSKLAYYKEEYAKIGNAAMYIMNLGRD